MLCFAARFGVAMALAVAILALLRLYYERLRMSCLESSEWPVSVCGGDPFAREGSFPKSGAPTTWSSGCRV